MPTPAEQGEAASTDDLGIARFVSAEKDLVAKPGSDQDSWFVIAQLASDRGPLDLLSHFLHMTPPAGDSFVQAMYSLLIGDEKTYLTEEKAYPLPQCTLSLSKLEVLTPSGNFTGNASSMHLTGVFEQIQFDLNLVTKGPMMANLGNGLIPFLGDINYHYALPTLSASGTLTIDGKTQEVSGTAWLDRQWGKTPRFFAPGPKKWIWFGIRLDNGDRISVWDVAETGRQHVFATILHPSGGHEIVPVEPLEKSASKPWKSPKTGFVYPTSWKIHIPALDAVFEQEIVSPVGAHKYEGSSSLTGTMRGVPVTGRAIIELVGTWN